MTLQKVLAQFGKMYVERDSALGPCPTQEEIKRYQRPTQKEFPFFMVYPARGMYVSIDSELKVQEIVFLGQCT